MAHVGCETHMRRCAIVDSESGYIRFEGVWIEGKFLMRNTWDGGIYIINEEDIDKYFSIGMNWTLQNILVWQDGKDSEWVPVENKELRFDGERYWAPEELDE